METAKRTNDIVVVASCNVDLVSYVNKMPKMGETIMGNRFKMGFGGKGANKAIACARLGSSCLVIAKVGDDVFGNDYLKNFKENNIDTSHIGVTSEAATGVAPICVDETGNNSIIVILGANLLLNSANIDASKSMIEEAQLLLTNLEIPIETAAYSLKMAKSLQKTTILNFAPAVTLARLAESSNDVERHLFDYVDYLILNEVEVEQLSQLEIKKSSIVDDAKQASLSLLNKINVNVGVIVTLGELGVLYASRKNQDCIHVKGTKCNVVDTTGAGDAFCGSFAHFLNKLGADSISQVLELANEYASLTVQSFGTQSSYPRLDQLDKKFH